MRLASLSRRPLARLAAAAAALTLLATGCIPLGEDDPAPGDDRTSSDDGGEEDGQGDQGPQLAELGTSAAQELPSDPASDPAYASYYEQDIEWGPCEDVEQFDSSVEMQCAAVTVPLVWDDPAAGDIDLAVAQQPARGEATGSLLLNPGGPGGSGVDFAGSASYVFSQQVQQSYNLVGFDPRGVGRSAGIECLSDEETDEYRSVTVEPGTTEASDWMDRIAGACDANSGEMLPYMDTYSVARDLDVLRAAVDSEQLDYFGFSYGTYLGATYADLYPERVGRFVLDAALDPTVTADELSAGQAEGFEQATESFLADCLERGEQCPFKGEVADAKQQLHAFFDSVDAEPLDTGDPQRPLTGALARSAVLMLLYDDAYWQMGRSALTDAMQGDGAQMLQFSDLSAGRNPDGTYSDNSQYAITAVNCLDHPGVVDEQWQQQEAERLAEEFPTFGPSMGHSGSSCAQWPTPPVREPAPISAEGAGPIVVIGTTRDPATPYEWSQNMAEQLDDAVLLTFEGDGHTAYGRSGGCIEEQVDAYLLEGTVPEDGLTC